MRTNHLKIAELSNGQCTSSRFPNFIFTNRDLLIQSAESCLEYESAVAEFTRAVRPAAVRRVLNTVRRCGYRFTARDARESAITALRERLRALPWFDEQDVLWHVANPGNTERIWIT